MVQRGFALLIVLWSLVLIAFLVTKLTATGGTEARIAQNVRQQAVLQAEADGAVFEAAFHLRDRSDAHWAADGVPHRLDRPGLIVTVRVEDEAGKVSVNRASADLLHALLQVAGADPARAALVARSLVNWREHDRARPSAAKIAPYLAAGLAYGPPETPFRTLEECGRVLGMDSALLDRLRPHLTLYSTSGPTGASHDPMVRDALALVRQAGGPLPDQESQDAVDVIGVAADVVAADGTRAARQAVLGFEKRTQGDALRVLSWD